MRQSPRDVSVQSDTANISEFPVSRSAAPSFGDEADFKETPMLLQISEKIIIDSPRSFEHWFTKERLPPCEIEIRDICGRMLKGRKEEDFVRLSDEPPSWRRVCFLAGPDTLQRLIGSRDGRDCLMKLGLGPTMIEQRMKDQFRFRLAVFPMTRKGLAFCRNADWSGVLELLHQCYAEVVDKVLPHWDHIHRTHYSSIDPHRLAERVADQPIDIRNGDERFLTVERFASLSDVSPWHVRAFLFHTLSLNAHFTGNGLTVDSLTGQVSGREYLAPNVEVASLEEAVVIPIDVK